MPIPFEHTETHESYGLCSFSRVSCGGAGVNLFGSSMRHSTIITLTIRRAEKHRDLSRDWFFGREDLIEVAMSPTQFVEAITAMNIGSGVPCTIQHINRQQVAPCPEINQRQIFEKEFERDVRRATTEAAKLAADAKEIMSKKTILKADREQLLETLRSLMGMVQSAMPFVQSQFNEAMDKTVNEAKGEVEAVVNLKVQSRGLDSLQQLARVTNDHPPQLAIDVGPPCLGNVPDVT